VYVCALDARKAFDNINHNVLTKKLVLRNVPIRLIHIIVDWYSKLTSAVRWNNILSFDFTVYCGVWHGGVRPSVLFNVYLNDVEDLLSTSVISLHFIVSDA